MRFTSWSSGGMSSNGKFVGILSTRESSYEADGREAEDEEEAGIKVEGEGQQKDQTAGEGEKRTKEGETEERRKGRKGTSAERGHELLLSLWKWPEIDEGGGAESPVEAGVPQRLVMTKVTQLRSHQVTRMSLSRGVPQSVLAVVIAAEDELWVWRLQEGPLGRRLVSSTIGFGLLPPDTVLTTWCLSGDAFALGVGGGWVMVSAGGEVRARMGGAGRGGTCHDGPLTDLYLHGSHLYTTGGDGWLRVWEAETLEEAAVTAAGNTAHEGWCETGVRTVSLQLVREVLVHVGPGAPVTLIPALAPHLVWILQTDSGVVYGVWGRKWAAEVLHQGPSGRVTGVAMATTHALLATTTQHRYLQVTPLPLSYPPAGVGEPATVPTALAAAPVDGDPTCVSWATCQISGEDDLLVLGLSDGALNVFLLHTSPKDPREKLSLVQVERPHESPVALIATKLKKTGTIDKENGKDENAGEAPLLVTAGEDSRLFIFRLVRVGKVTKLEPVGYYQLLDIPERIKIKSDVIHVETSTGVVFEVTADLSSTSRPSPESWRLHHHSSPREVWQTETTVQRQLLEEVTESYCAPDAVVLAVPSPDGETIVGVTSRGDVVHLHLSQTTSYSVRLARRQPCAAPSVSHSPTLVLPPGDPCDVIEDGRGAFGRRAVVGVSEDGSWAAAWVSGGDLFLYRARGASFPLPQELPAHLRLVGVRGAGGGAAGLSLEQRAQKEAGERRKTAMEERAALIQQKLSKLKWDFRKLSLRADEIEGGRLLLEDVPLHPAITTSLHKHTTDNMNKVVAGSSSELERLEVLLGKLRTLYSWSPLVSSLSVKALGSDETLSSMDTSEQVFALLVRLAQLRQSNTVVGGAALVGGPAEVENGQGDPVVQVKELLEYWLKAIRSDQKNSQAVPIPNPDPDEEEDPGEEPEAPLREEAAPVEGGGSVGGGGPASEGAAGGGGHLAADPSASAALRPTRTPDNHEGDTGDEEETQTIAALQAQVREAVARVGAAGRSGGGGGGGGEGGASEADLDVGRELKWRRMALNRLKDYRNREDSRTTKLVDYKAKHSLPPEEGGHKDEGGDGGGDGGGGGGSEVEPPFDIENEVKVPPPSVSVRAVEAQLWTLLGNLEIDCKKIRENVNRIARVQENLLQQVNLFRAEWGHALFTLPHLPHHLQVQVSDELVNEFYCDLLELEECEDADDVTGGRATRTVDETHAHAHATAAGAGRKRLSRKGSEGTDVPPLSLAATPRAAKTPKAQQTARSPRAVATARTPSNSTSRTPRTTQRSGRGRRSVRESPKPPPTPRPPMSLEQVQMIQRRRTNYLSSLIQVPEQLKDLAREADRELSQCRRAVVGERGRLTWAVLRAGQLVKAVGVRVKYKEAEKKLRLALQEKIQERHVIKEKVLGLRERIHEYDLDLECLESLENEVDQAFAHLVTDHAQFEVQLTRYFESRTSAGPARRDSVSSRSSGDGEDGEDDGGDNDSGLGSDEARVGGEEGGPRPPGCDPAVFSLVTVLRDLRWRVAGAAESVRKERAIEDRRHTAVLRRLVRANHLTHGALGSLTGQEAARESELGAIPTVVWLRKSQTGGSLSGVTRLPIPNTEMDSLAAVRWVGEGERGGEGEATLLTGDHLRQLEHRVALAKKTQDLAAKKRREGRAERRYLAMQVEQLRRKLDHLRNTCQVSRECKLGVGAEADLTAVEEKLAASLDLRWPGKIANQQSRHIANMKQLQTEVSGRTRELRALQREEAALAAHILALRQEKDHLHYHLAQTPTLSDVFPPAVVVRWLCLWFDCVCVCVCVSVCACACACACV
ncbi:uncharacterized protein LOC125028883 isoform X2 [Penaeus chinensis]|uniref:uncharacterized protein LOC125028883 isoform X2 n=1 Tax=Penaeus chinensis TaxID=139456 RepID=UPI001FB5EE62|nr:uncharacterized protein LOC125028883 isoform X2 [Penaeus chinensis]